MKRAPLHRHRKGIYLLALFTFLTATVIALTSAARVKTADAVRAATTPAPDASAAGHLPRQLLSVAPAAGQGTVEAEVIALRPSGFEPNEITRPAGRVLLAVSDQSGLEGSVLRLTREGAARVHEVRLPKGRRLWRKVVELAPGDYTLTEASRPEWACHIVITR